MTNFQKLQKQTLNTDVWEGNGTLHKQPKEHDIHRCTATIENIYKDSIQIAVWFENPNDIFIDGMKLVVRKSNVTHTDTDFIIVITPESEKEFIIRFIVPDKYF